MSRYVIRGGREGYDRLKVRARTYWPETSELLRRAGVEAGMRCADVGCGSGDVSLELARMVGPDGRVTGFDMDEVKLGPARAEAAAAALENVEFVAADVTRFDVAASYDLVYARFLLQHLPDPAEVLRRLYAAVAPGGRLVVEDADFGGVFVEPPSPGADFFVRTYSAVLESHGGDPAMGRKLHAAFRAAGIRELQLGAVQQVFLEGEAKTLFALTIEATADTLVEHGVATRAEIEDALADLERVAADPAVLVGLPRTFQAIARRTSPFRRHWA